MVHGLYPWAAFMCKWLQCIFTFVDCLTKYTVLTACTLGAGELSAKQVAQMFFQGAVR